MKNIITIEEAKLMEGTEFDYYCSNGDWVKAFVKKFDPKKGLTCETLTTKTERDGCTGHNLNEDGTWCVIGFDFSIKSNPIVDALKNLTEIKNTGKYVVKRRGCGTPSCSFMG